LESMISAFILFLIIIIGILIYVQQFDYDEEKFDAVAIQAGTVGQSSVSAINNEVTLDIAGFKPNGFTPMSERESFDRGTLSDKINGKADLYLESGFVELTAGRFVDQANPALWFEIFLYDMTLPRNAFAVYSSQKRDGVIHKDFAKFAYSTENAVFFVQGKFYIEIIGARPDDALIRSMISMAKHFITLYPADTLELPELRYLPSENLDLGSISIILANGFGFEKFNHIFTGTYHVNGYKITAFVSLRKTAGKAESLATDYDNFLTDFIGGDRLEPETGLIPGLTVVDLFGEYEMVFATQNVLAGVHSAPDKQLGEQIAVNLYKTINGLEK